MVIKLNWCGIPRDFPDVRMFPLPIRLLIDEFDSREYPGEPGTRSHCTVWTFPCTNKTSSAPPPPSHWRSKFHPAVSPSMSYRLESLISPPPPRPHLHPHLFSQHQLFPLPTLLPCRRDSVPHPRRSDISSWMDPEDKFDRRGTWSSTKVPASHRTSNPRSSPAYSWSSQRSPCYPGSGSVVWFRASSCSNPPRTSGILGPSTWRCAPSIADLSGTRLYFGSFLSRWTRNL